MHVPHATRHVTDSTSVLPRTRLRLFPWFKNTRDSRGTPPRAPWRVQLTHPAECRQLRASWCQACFVGKPYVRTLRRSNGRPGICGAGGPDSEGGKRLCVYMGEEIIRRSRPSAFDVGTRAIASPTWLVPSLSFVCISSWKRLHKASKADLGQQGG